MYRGLKLFDAIAEPVFDVLDKTWFILLPVAAVVIVAAVILRILRKRKKAKTKDE